jgi:hypothetical protein
MCVRIFLCCARGNGWEASVQVQGAAWSAWMLMGRLVAFLEEDGIRKTGSGGYDMVRSGRILT